jgi:putative lipoic acid-binding regulatory protein
MMKKDIMEFPCDFPIKAMGYAQEDFDVLVVDIIRRHVSDVNEGAVTTRASREGKYLSVTVHITATSRAQLDNIYRDLTSSEHVLVAL